MIRKDVKVMEAPQEVVALLQCPLDAKALQLDGGIIAFGGV